MPNAASELIKGILADLARDTRVDLHHFPIQVDVRDDTLVLEGIVENIAAKRIIRHAAHRHADPRPVLDRLRVAVPVPEGAGKLRDEVVHLLQGESEFNAFGLAVRDGDRVEILRTDRSEWGNHCIEIEVRDGLVILSGEVLSLAHRRLAEVLAWWAAGCECVENLLHVVPPEEETDDELADAVRLVLEKDPLVRADQLQIVVQQGVVTLEGLAGSDEERHLAVQDAWYIQGVRDVVDRIQVGG